MVAFRQPGRFGVRNLAELANDLAVNYALHALDDTDLETLVLRLLDHFVSVKAIKGLCSVFAGYTINTPHNTGADSTHQILRPKALMHLPGGGS